MHLAAKLALAGLVPVSLLAGKLCLGGPCGSHCAASAEATMLDVGPSSVSPISVSPNSVSPNSVSPNSGAVAGRYVEARSASVYAGACHYGAEYTTQGREAVLAWELEGGQEGGVSLAGVEVVAVVSGDANLAEADAARHSVVYLDEGLPASKREAVLAWLGREHGEALGAIRQVKQVPLSVDCEGDRYAVRVADLVRLEGEAMPDRACCSMPSNVWYRPMVALDGRLVGQSQVLEVSDPDVGPAFARHDENDAFLGTLSAPERATCPFAHCAPAGAGDAGAARCGERSPKANP